MDVEKPSVSSMAQERQYQRVLTVAIALPVCLVTVFLLLGCLLWWQRHRIVQDLNRRYFGPNFNGRPLQYSEDKRWSADNSPTTGTPLSDLPIQVGGGAQRQHFDHSPSGRRTPDNPLRALGTTNFPGPKQNFIEKSRCITPDTPSGRREQLESRAQLIQNVHQRVREGSITPDLLSPRRVVSLDRVNEERTELERPSSPTGSIRVVEAAHVPRRAASDAIRSRLDEVFQPDWRPESASGSYARNEQRISPERVCQMRYYREMSQVLWPQTPPDPMTTDEQALNEQLAAQAMDAFRQAEEQHRNLESEDGEVKWRWRCLSSVIVKSDGNQEQRGGGNGNGNGAYILDLFFNVLVASSSTCTCSCTRPENKWKDFAPAKAIRESSARTLQAPYDNAAARIAKMNQDLGSSIWSNSASGNENARPTQPIAAAPSAPKSSLNTSTATNNSVNTTSLPPRGHAVSPHVQGSARALSPALSTSSATSSRTDTTVDAMANPAPRGPTLYNPQQAKLLKSDPDWQETRQTSARPPRSRAPAVARSPAPPPAPRQSFMASASATPSRAPASDAPPQWNQMQREEPRGRVTETTNTVVAATRDRLNDPKPVAPAPAMRLPQATARDDGNVGGGEKAPKIESNANTTSGSVAAKPAVGLSPATSSSSSSSSGDKLVEAMKARMLRMDAMLEAQEHAKKAKVETPAAPLTAANPAPVPSTPSTAPPPVFPPPSASNAAKQAAAEPSAADYKADIMTKAAAVEKKVELPVLPPAAKLKPTAPHLRNQAATEKPAEPLKTEPKVQPKVESKAEIMVEPKIEPKAEPKAAVKAAVNTEPKLEPFATAPKPTYTTKLTAMPTPAASPATSGDAAYAKRLGDYEAMAKQNPARAAMEWDFAQEMNNVFQDVVDATQEKQALAAKLVEMTDKIKYAIAMKDERIARNLNHLAMLKKMRIEEEELAKKDEAKLNRLKQEE
ncbi:hypothetical protein AC578_1104 [Pseudocercospora eumusae]|uniref:Uncharacterized protein n=1 Tax=Pseudocercospora eumusae TaxID=321146 RepID=A0A139HTS7_9PEZI|nr:hypothetical protein AC578_1104 [Pseudocercospora eumusae]